MTTPALFVDEGDQRWTATEWSRGPWDPRSCHGGPVGALLARAVEHVDGAPGLEDSSDAMWQIARLTVELTRPVPVGRPLRLVTTIERPGRRVGLVAGLLTDDETDAEVARVRALRIRRDPGVLGDEVPARPDEPGFALGPDDSRPEVASISDDEMISFARHACEHRFAEGSWDEPGPVAVWIRITVPLVADEAMTAVQRTVAAADFGNGVSAVLPWDRYSFVNPDLTVHLAREAAGEWIGLRAASHIGDAGAGLAQSALHDVDGPIGTSLQSLFIAART